MDPDDRKSSQRVALRVPESATAEKTSWLLRSKALLPLPREVSVGKVETLFNTPTDSEKLSSTEFIRHEWQHSTYTSTSPGVTVQAPLALDLSRLEPLSLEDCTSPRASLSLDLLGTRSTLSLSQLNLFSSSHSDPCTPRQRLLTPQSSPKNTLQTPAGMTSPVWREPPSCESSSLNTNNNSLIRLRTGSSSAPVTPRPSQRGIAPTLRLPPLSTTSPPKSSSSSSSSSYCYSFPEGI
eukprot:gene1881-2459_t